MKGLSTEEKVELIISQAEKHDITAYEFGNNTEISTFAAEQLLKRKTKKPGHKTISQMLQYIEQRIVGTQVKENPTSYSEKRSPPSIENQLAERVFEMMMPELREMKKEILKAILNLDIEVSELRNVQEELLRVQKEIEKSCNNSVRILEEKL